MIQRTRSLLIKPNPGLPFPAPMQQTHRSFMQRPTASSYIVPSQTMLVPPVINRFNVPREYQKKRRQRTQIVDSSFLLYLHPSFDLFSIAPFPPPHEIHHHHTRVEVARLPTRERPGQTRVGPETRGEVFSEVSVTILRSPDDSRPGQRRVPELGDIVDHDDVRVEVDDPVDAPVEDVS